MYKLLTLKDVAPTGAAIFRPRSQWSFPARLLLLAAPLIPVHPALAQDLTPIASVAENIAAALQGPFAVAVATIGFIGCGLLAMSGKMPWGSAIAVLLGIILIFGAPALVDEIKAVAN